MEAHFLSPSSAVYQTTDAAAGVVTTPWLRNTHTQVQSMTRYTLMLSIVSAGVNSPPHQAQESVLSRMAEYPGPLPSPPLLRYPSMVYFCPCISLLSAKCLWRLPLQQTDEGCQWWVAEDRTANQNNLSNALKNILHFTESCRTRASLF